MPKERVRLGSSQLFTMNTRPRRRRVQSLTRLWGPLRLALRHIGTATTLLQAIISQEFLRRIFIQEESLERLWHAELAITPMENSVSSNTPPARRVVRLDIACSRQRETFTKPASWGRAMDLSCRPNNERPPSLLVTVLRLLEALHLSLLTNWRNELEREHDLQLTEVARFKHLRAISQLSKPKRSIFANLRQTPLLWLSDGLASTLTLLTRSSQRDCLIRREDPQRNEWLSDLYLRICPTRRGRNRRLLPRTSWELFRSTQRLSLLNGRSHTTTCRRVLISDTSPCPSLTRRLDRARWTIKDWHLLLGHLKDSDLVSLTSSLRRTELHSQRTSSNPTSVM